MFFIDNFSELFPAAAAEPFLPPVERFDTLTPGPNCANWLLASLLEQYEKLHSFSSYFSGEKALPVLEKLEETGFLSEEMERRLMLVRKFLKNPNSNRF